MSHIEETIRQLTVNVCDVEHKPLLRPVLEAELFKLKYQEEEITAALDKLFKVTLQ